MKKTLLVFVALACSWIALAQQVFENQTLNSPDGKYTYTQVKNDPLKVRTYVLKNGLTVMMSVNKKQPRVQTLIATKAGSKNDPADNTGLAHYLEHMLFKGTDKFGSLDWEKEKKQLDLIDALYERYNKTTDEAKRKAIYKQIDSVSGVASKYAIANEYDKMMQMLGTQGTNAFTSLEQTVYLNDVPENNLEKWIGVEAERFRNPILRLFHTELEAVYEEKNISLDNDSRKVFESMLGGLFKKHSYGTQTTIGTVEHLKNPSLVKIRNYYNTYYVPNNMAIILVGDFDPDRMIQVIDEKFSYMQAKPVPAFTFQPEMNTGKPEEINVYGPDAENLMIGFRFPGGGTREALLLQMTDMLLANSKAGLIDLNLVKKQAVLGASSSSWINKDYSIMFLSGKPVKNQKLEEVKQLLLDQIELLKQGKFDDETLKAIIANLKIYKIRERESNEGRAYAMLDAFCMERSWKDAAAELDQFSTVTREEIIAFVNKWFTNDYVVVYKRLGEDKSISKIEKPEITPVEVNREDVSPFVKALAEKPSNPIKPRFVDFDKDMTRTGNIYYVKNNDNALFSLYYVLDMGKFHDKKLPLAVNLLEYLGTDKYSSEQISKEFFKLACDFKVNVSNEQVYVTLSGLDENFVPALRLFEHLLANAKPNQDALNQLVDRILKSREDAKKTKSTIFRAALQSYAMYGSNNPFKYELSATELKAIQAAELAKYIHTITSYPHKIWYFGPQNLEGLQTILKKEHKTPAKALAIPKPAVFTRQDTKENQVYFVNYDMVQAEIMWLSRSLNGFDASRTPMVSMFNEYFGSGMSSIVFQTIRESKALAYSTYARYLQPSKQNDPYYVLAYVGTQADKMNEAVAAMNELLTQLPQAGNMFDAAKASLMNGIETERTNDADIIFSYVANEKLGLKTDMNKMVYEALPTISLADVTKFHEANLKGKPYTYCIMGSKAKISDKDLAKYGKVTELSLEEIFGY